MYSLVINSSLLLLTIHDRRNFSNIVSITLIHRRRCKRALRLARLCIEASSLQRVLGSICNSVSEKMKKNKKKAYERKRRRCVWVVGHTVQSEVLLSSGCFLEMRALHGLFYFILTPFLVSCFSLLSLFSRFTCIIIFFVLLYILIQKKKWELRSNIYFLPKKKYTALWFWLRCNNKVLRF